jgi:hypothetical protein
MSVEREVEYGAHLPLIDLGPPRSLDGLAAYARTAARLGYRYLCANDMTLVTTAALPVLRGPVPLAKTLAAIDVLSGGRLVAGVGPGSSAGDYAAAGIGFEERWPRFDEAVQALRALLHGDREGLEGEFYSTRGVVLEPPPVQAPGPPIWVASWGSAAGLRRVARLGDGWLASAYNTTPERYRQSLDRLARELARAGPAAGRPRRAVRRAARRLGGGGRAAHLRLAARRRTRAAGAVPRARHLPGGQPSSVRNPVTIRLQSSGLSTNRPWPQPGTTASWERGRPWRRARVWSMGISSSSSPTMTRLGPG